MEGSKSRTKNARSKILSTVKPQEMRKTKLTSKHSSLPTKAAIWLKSMPKNTHWNGADKTWPRAQKPQQGDAPLCHHWAGCSRAAGRCTTGQLPVAGAGGEAFVAFNSDRWGDTMQCLPHSAQTNCEKHRVHRTTSCGWRRSRDKAGIPRAAQHGAQTAAQRPSLDSSPAPCPRPSPPKRTPLFWQVPRDAPRCSLSSYRTIFKVSVEKISALQEQPNGSSNTAETQHLMTRGLLQLRASRAALRQAPSRRKDTQCRAMLTCFRITGRTAERNKTEERRSGARPQSARPRAKPPAAAAAPGPAEPCSPPSNAAAAGWSSAPPVRSWPWSYPRWPGAAVPPGPPAPPARAAPHPAPPARPGRDRGSVPPPPPLLSPSGRARRPADVRRGAPGTPGVPPPPGPGRSSAAGPRPAPSRAASARARPPRVSMAAPRPVGRVPRCLRPPPEMTSRGRCGHIGSGQGPPAPSGSHFGKAWGGAGRRSAAQPSWNGRCARAVPGSAASVGRCVVLLIARRGRNPTAAVSGWAERAGAQSGHWSAAGRSGPGLPVSRGGRAAGGAAGGDSLPGPLFTCGRAEKK